MVLVTQAVFAQDNVTVPDLTGKSLPQAAALLNKSGLLLGKETSEGWTQSSGLPQNSIRAQSAAAGSSVGRGTAVDVTVLRSPNVVLIYDDNNFTMLNITGAPLNLGEIAFNAVGGTSPASFNATEWGGTMNNTDCGQLWSVRARNAKPVGECHSTRWLATTNAAKHFWTGANGATQFNVMQNGVERIVCPVSTSGRCEFYLPGGAVSDPQTEYIYFAYTTDRLIILNQSQDQWMPLAQLKVYNRKLPKTPVTIGDPGLFSGQGIMGDVTRLAPGECLYFTNGGPQPDAPPQPCTPIARLDIDPKAIFWAQDFDMDSVTDGKRRTCPAPAQGNLVICVMPR
jgi:hypothetical protein